jgi:hypothetical protein
MQHWSTPLSKFIKKEEYCKALLLPITRCGRGLNLTNANATIFMEPVQSAVGKFANYTTSYTTQ